MLKLNNLVTSGKRRKRIGRGGARGGTSGRGMGGQNSRSGGGVSVTFEGGQMPLARRLPKRGFSNARFTKIFEIIDLGDLESRCSAGEIVTYDFMVESGLIKGTRGAMVKVLGDGELVKKLTVHAHAFSKTARSAIEKIGGEVHVIAER